MIVLNKCDVSTSYSQADRMPGTCKLWRGIRSLLATSSLNNLQRLINNNHIAPIKILCKFMSPSGRRTGCHHILWLPGSANTIVVVENNYGCISQYLKKSQSIIISRYYERVAAAPSYFFTGAFFVCF
jgi:hypothetical protein